MADVIKIDEAKNIRVRATISTNGKVAKSIDVAPSQPNQDITAIDALLSARFKPVPVV